MDENETPQEEIEPSSLDLLAPELIAQPREQALSRLKDIYTNNNWTDKELAAQSVSEIADIMNKRDQISAKIELDADALIITQRILDSNLSEDDKIESIEQWRKEYKQKLYNTDDADSLVVAADKERMIDDYALQLRRHVTAGDTGFILDKLARGAEAAIAPLADVADLALDTDYGRKVREYALEHENPERDNTISSVFASGIGSVAGFTAAASNPYTALGYLGSVITSQGKQVYDTALEETGSEEAAKNVLYQSAPGILLQGFADRLIGGTLAKTIAGKKGFLGTLTGATTGAGGMAAQSFLTGEALASVTGQEKFEPTPEQVGTEALVGGVLGAAVGGLADLSRTELGFKQLHDQFKKTVNKDKATPPTQPEPNDATTVSSYLQQYVIPEEGVPVETTGGKEDLSLRPGLDVALNSEQILADLVQAGVPSERIAALESMLKERNKVSLMTTKFPEPLSEAAYAAKEQEFQNDIAEIHALGDEELAGRVKDSMKAWKTFQEQYKNDPETAASVKTAHAQYREITEKFYEELGKLRKETGKPELLADVGEATVLQAARAMPLRGPVPETDLSPLQKIIPVAPPGFVPQPAVVALTRKILGEWAEPKSALEIKLANESNMKLMFGFFDPNTHAVVVRRQLFKSQDQAERTLNHEVGHMIDYYGRSEAVKQQLNMQPVDTEPVALKLTRLGQPLKTLIETMQVQDDARNLSSEWRLGWDNVDPVPAGPPPAEETPERAKYDMLVYRNDPRELYADVMSAILIKPQLVKAEYPLLWQAFEQGVNSHPILKKFWSDIQAMNNDPQKLAAFMQSERQSGRVREAKATAKQAEHQIMMHEELKKQEIRGAAGAIRQSFGNRYSVARDLVEAKIKEASPDVNEVEELYSKLYTGSMANAAQNVEINEPEVRLFKEVKALEARFPAGAKPIDEFKNLMRATRVLEDTTEEMINIKKDPVGYREAFEVMKAEADKLATAKGGVNPIKDVDVSKLSDQPLVDTIAESQAYITAEERKLLSEQIMNERGKALSPADMKALEILDDSAFSARRYMANPDITPKLAEVEIALMKSRLGEENFKELKTLLDKHHDIMFNYLWPRIKEAGIFTPKLERRFELNKRSYAMFNALKYFEQDPHITASVRKAIGNINKIGDEWAATIRKTRMIGARADFQISSNSAVELAGKSGVDIEEVTPKMTFTRTKEGESKVFIDSLYKTQKQLQADHPENSYLIATEDGKSKLFKIKDPRWAKMFEHSSMEQLPVLKTGLSLLEDFSRMTTARESLISRSVPFWLRSKFYDRSQESLAGGAPWYDLPGLPFHTSKKFRELHQQGKKFATQIQRGEIDKTIEGLFEYNGIVHHMTDEVGGYYSPALRAENMIYEELGFPIPGEEQLDLPLKINRKINAAFEKIGFGKLRDAIENDELTAKVTMYLIGRNIKGMTEARAARFARELGGTPDPFGGGVEASALNKLFLFGRAHINGMRGLYSMLKSDPASFSSQYLYRRAMPRILMSSALMGPLIGAMFGDEDEQVYRKFLDKVPSFDKLSKLAIPFGFVDDKGHFRGFDVKADEINQNWKASYLALPVSRDLVTADTLMTPFFKNIEDYAETGAFSLKRIAKSVIESFSSAVGGQFAPGVTAAVHAGQLAGGGNPYDYYRNRGILPKDVEEAGTFMDKTYRYLVWSLNQSAPGIFSFNTDKQSSTEPSTPWDYLVSTPLAGSTIKAFVRQSNYGDLEKYKELQQLKVERDADIRLGMGDKSKTLYNDYKKANAYVSRMGKNWAQHSNPQQIRRIHILQNWHARAYRHGFNGMRAAFDNNDSAALQNEAEKLEQSSAYVSELLEQP